MDIYLIRHGKTEGNLQGRYIGSTDEPLCEEGKRALFSMKEQKKYPYPEYLFQSPMKRCKESAEILFPQKEACTVSDLRECDFGRFEGKNYLELQIIRDGWTATGRFRFRQEKNRRSFAAAVSGRSVRLWRIWEKSMPHRRRS